MTMGQLRSKYERDLAHASWALMRAAEGAERIGDEGAMDDCLQIRTEVSRLLEDSTNGRKRRRQQLDLLDTPCA